MAGSVDASVKRAIAAHQAGRLAEAQMMYQTALLADPKHAVALHHLGITYFQQGQLQNGIGFVQRAIAAKPDYAAAHYDLGNALCGLQRFAEGAAHFEKALAIQPSFAEAASNLGNALHALGDNERAVKAFETALRLKPNAAPTLYNLGIALQDLGRHEDAVAQYRKAVQFAPDHARAYCNCANSLIRLKRPDEAAAALDRAIALQPNMPEAWAGRGNLYSETGRHADAIAAYDRALALKPDNFEVCFHRALVKLALRQFDSGWTDFERRWQSPRFLQANTAGTLAKTGSFKLYNSEAALAGKKILVVTEQGIGDEIMFLGMLTDLLARGNTVTWECDARLLRLLSHSFPDVRFVDAKAPPGGSYDVTLPAGSLGHAFRRSIDSFPKTPYLVPRPERIDHWKGRIGPDDGRLKVGISWRGGVATTRATERSMPLDDLSPLLAMEGCRFISLQYGEAEAEVAAANSRLGTGIDIFARPDIDDFEELAALVLSLDLVVSVQTALVHVCGAAGQRCLAMIHSTPEWRYGLVGDAMPWYGSVELYRQTAGGGWPPVIGRVAEQVKARRDATR